MIVTIDGNIGAGKTTALRLLQEKGYDIDLEPVEKWEPLLHDIYYNKKSPYMFQTIVYEDRARYKPNSPLCFVERSPYFTENVFLEAHRQLFTEAEMRHLKFLYKRSWKPDLMIYLQSQPDECLMKIQKRSRESEKNIDPDYIKRLHDMHEFTYHRCIQTEFCPIQIINVDNMTPGEVADTIIRLTMP